MAKREFPKVKTILNQAFDTYKNLSDREVEKLEKDVYSDIHDLVAQTENTGAVPEKLYKEIIRCYPRLRDLLDSILEHALFNSFYTLDPKTINFRYDAYFKQIERFF